MENELRFQHDSAPQHYAFARELIECPPRSPDLAPQDFSLWDHLKLRVNSTSPDMLNV